MANDPNKLKFSRSIKAPAENLYYAFTKRSGWSDWFCEGVEGDAQKFKQIFLTWKIGESAGLHFTKFKENKQLVFTWYGSQDERPSEVTVNFTEKGGVTEVVVEHRAVAAAQVEQMTKIWEDGLDNLKSVFEEGVDLRISARPMFGVLIEDMVTPEYAKEKNLPIDHGMLLGETLPGMGAEASGLAGGDLIYEISGIKIEDYHSIDAVISPRKAGDIVEMHYLRGEEKYTAEVELTYRPMPEIPPTAHDFSEKVSETYECANAKIDEVIEGVTEQQAEYRTKPGEWHSKEVFAHLISTERSMYAWAASLVQGWESYAWTDNLPARMKSFQVVYPRLLDLRRELGNAQQEGVVLVAELPAEFVSRKSAYVRLVNTFFMMVPKHYKDHITQIQDNLFAAQGLG
ncbi:MAG: SRPBCC domain-containing protein [Anaerolineales bacterium]|jgi:uncharacterized protein YndB with AHSA1/START domain